ncbi:zinc transporter ZIP14-like [Orbicella faveolata]|uniref:zinc transporter ZIP14-like n=1 Tax=Orbicella faveolata TaxID=48498 RepID=UPI0009E62135|nr:zinc transporter ZIP14-like [Orbicella faveolata]
MKNKIVMASTKAVYQFLAFLALSAIIQAGECHAVSVNLSAPQTFIWSLFDEFGSNNSMNSQQFNSLLKELNIGSSSSEQASGNGKSKCYTAKELFESFSVDSSGLNLDKFEKVCPAIVQQIESKACLDESEEHEEDKTENTARAWGFGFLSAAIISLASLLGAFVVPFMNQSIYKILLLFMVSLAVGVLSGNGFFHLIPHTFHLHGLENLWKSLVIVGGIYLFFLLEYVMKMIVRFKEKSASEKKEGLEARNPKAEVPGTAIAEVQLQLYNQDHHFSNRNMGVSTDLADFQNGSAEKKGLNEQQEVIVNTGGKKKVAPVAWMIIIGDALHNFIDGLAIGASYSSSTINGVSTSLAIFCEELPHELGDFAILLNAGMSYKMAMAFNFLSACSCFLGLVIGLVLGTKTSAVEWIYPLAGGMFVYISLVDMLQEATEMSAKLGQNSLGKNLKMFALQNFATLFGFVIMFILAVYEEQISLE